MSLRLGTGLTFGGYRLCHGCSRGLHVEHHPVNCDCDLPGCQEEKTP